MPKKKTTEEFVQDARKIHGDKYDYSKVDYQGSKKEVIIICPEHGEFQQTPNNHLKPQDCPYCTHRGYKYTNEEYIKKANEVHNGKYDYSITQYIDMKHIIQISCPIHGVFPQNPHNHLKGSGCPECGGRQCKTLTKFIDDANRKHMGKYDYSQVKYINNKTEVDIICRKHGVFPQTPNKHLLGEGCPDCIKSKLENEVECILKELGVPFISQASKKDLDWLERQSLDFYLPKCKIAIECQGEQHYRPVQLWGGNNTLASIQERDQRKAKKCTSHNIRILYYGNSLNKKYDNSLITNKEDLIKEIKNVKYDI